jgi:hypothetical protein
MAAVEPVFWGIPPEKAYAATGGRMDLLSARQQGAVASIVIVTILVQWRRQRIQLSPHHMLLGAVAIGHDRLQTSTILGRDQRHTI